MPSVLNAKKTHDYLFFSTPRVVQILIHLSIPSRIHCTVPQQSIYQTHILHIRSDSKILMDCINNRSRCVEIQSVLSDILALCTDFESISFMFISHSFNLEADSLAKRSLQDLVNSGPGG
ncbi:hypothetical protein Bca4012_032328 [Brassica carinata]